MAALNRMRPARWRALAAGLAIAMAAVGLGVGAAAGAWPWANRARGDATDGQALYHGRQGTAAPAVEARMVGHSLSLPDAAWSCSNCHEANAGSRYARLLNRESLTTAQPRRGGPPSRYDARSLCELLRTGIDPAQVMIDTTMPRYALSDAQCGQLWQYLQTR